MEQSVTKIAEHNISRTRVSAHSLFLGLLIGLYNSFYPSIDLTPDAAFFAWLAGAIVFVVFAHEAVHASVAKLLGFRPIFGLKLPLVYVTFKEKIPRGQFLLIVLGPLVILNAVFGIFFVSGFLKVFSYSCLIINTLGAAGDLWVTSKIIAHHPGTLIQDTKTGLEVWRKASHG